MLQRQRRTRRLIVRVTTEQHAQVLELAAQLGVSVTKVVRAAMDEYAQRLHGKPIFDRRRRSVAVDDERRDGPGRRAYDAQSSVGLAQGNRTDLGPKRTQVEG